MAQQRIPPNQLPSNNRDSPNQPRPKPEAVASGRPKDKGRSLSHEVRNIVNDLITSVIIPSTKNMAYQFLMDGLGQLILGKENSSAARGLPGTHRAYHSMYGGLTNRANPLTRYTERAKNPRPDIIHQDIFFNTEEEALLALAAMLERLATYQKVTLGDFRYICRLKADTTHQRYYWTDLDGSEVIPTSEGWLITLPPLEYQR